MGVLKEKVKHILETIMGTNHKRITVTKLNEHVYLMDDAGTATGYVVVGNEKAAVIDTMNGVEDVVGVVTQITDLPAFVINTHGHPDHILGNFGFEEVYMHPADNELAAMFTQGERFDALARGRKLPAFRPTVGGDVFDLGGLHLEVIELPGHTLGGICLLLQEDRILFTGDSINHHLWMQLDGCLSMAAFLENLNKIEFVKEKADYIAHGHAKGFDDISLFDKMRKGVRELAEQVNGEVTAKDEPYNWSGGVDKQHKFDEDGSVICYKA